MESGFLRRAHWSPKVGNLERNNFPERRICHCRWNAAQWAFPRHIPVVRVRYHPLERETHGRLPAVPVACGHWGCACAPGRISAGADRLARPFPGDLAERVLFGFRPEADSERDWPDCRIVQPAIARSGNRNWAAPHGFFRLDPEKSERY